MNTKYTNVIMLAVAALAAGNALAADPAAAKTRAQVQAELQEAQRTGDIVDAGTGQKLNQLQPSHYPAKAAAQGRTRAEVKAELAEARRTGDIVYVGTGKKMNELNPDLFPAKAVAPSRSRSEVNAELKEAQRTGNLTDGGTGQKLNEFLCRSRSVRVVRRQSAQSPA
ncbi:MAG: DUF4148 domain-containing protein [Burkholderiales bacterium]|nr:DUF4148 domain-containing protein [Burkholderiales bacterium]